MKKSLGGVVEDVFKDKDIMDIKVKKNIAISESGFIFDPTSGDSYLVNEIGLEIIKFLKEETHLDEIKNSMIEKYDIDSQSFEKYYLDFIQMLKGFNLME